MTELLSDVDSPSDAELISRVRGGDVAAYGDLFSRHRDAANRLARQLVRGPDSDDLVSEAFAKVLTVLQGGGGPDVAFRAYLLTAVRRLHVDRVRTNQRLQSTDDMTPFDPGVPFRDTAVAGFESGAAAKAFASLPERWQLVLWHLEVEGQKPADIAPLLGMSANSVSALAYRAREGLRQAFLTMHLSDIAETDCRWVNEHLGAFVRKGLAKRDAAKVSGHLEECRRCTAMHLELTDVNSNLAAIIGPLLLGSAAAGYLATGGSVGSLGVLSLVARARDEVVNHTNTVVGGASNLVANAGGAVANAGGAVVAGAVSVGVAAAAIVAVTVTQHAPSPERTVADPPTAVTSTAPVSPGGPTASPSSSASSSPSTAPSATVSASPSPSATPTTLLSDLPTATPSPTDTPTLPLDTFTDLPVVPPAGPELDDPVVGADGTVTVSADNLRFGDQLDITMTSDETTFADPTSDPTCQVVSPRHVTCYPQLAAMRAGRTSAVADTGGTTTVTLPLDFPGYMVEDDLQVVARVGDDASARSVQASFHPSRTPTYDSTSPVLTGAPTHAVRGDVDVFTFTTTAALPPRVRGLVYRVGGSARFARTPGCDVDDDGSTLTCPDVRDGDPVDVPVAVTGLDASRTVGLTATPLVGFTDPTPDVDSTPLVLTPGADLGLDLSVFSADPDRDGRVALTGTVTGVRPAMTDVVYTLGEGATFPDTGNPGCTPDGARLTCPAPSDGTVALTVLADAPDQATRLAVDVAAGSPYEAVGSGHATAVTLPGTAVHDYSLTELTETGHTLDGDTDRHTLTGTVGRLPAGTSSVAFALTDGGRFAADQGDGSCHLDTTAENGGQVVCDDLARGGRVSLVVESEVHATHDATVEIVPATRFADPDPADDAATVTGLRPGTHLVVSGPDGTRDLGSLHQDDDGDYPVRATLTGVRPGLDRVRLTPDDGVTPVAVSTAGCVVDDARLVCDGLADGDTVSFTVASSTPATARDLTVTATPAGPFAELYDDHTATARLVPSFDFALTGLAATDHALTEGGDTDSYSLTGSVRRLPADLDALTFAVTGATFAADQEAGCSRLDDDHRVRCSGLDDGGRVRLHVTSTAGTPHPVGVRLLVPAGYDDPSADDDADSVTVAPGVDLHLTPLDADNESPTNDDDQHLVSTRLTGTRPGLGDVDFTLGGDASFADVDRAGCTVRDRTVTCTDPSDGPLTFTVRADQVRTATDVTVTARAGDPFVELDDSDNSDGVRLLPRPTYDFAMGTLQLVAHGLADASTDRYTVRTTVAALPEGLDRVGLAVTGGSLAADQPAGCTRVADDRATCTDLGSARAVDLRVDSGQETDHRVGVTLVPPRRYDDPDQSDNADEVGVQPGVDLHLGALTPARPVPSGSDYRVSGQLTGTRTGPVTLTLSGDATVVDSSCELRGPSSVSCDSSAGGSSVSLTLRPTDPTAATPVRVTATAADPLVELDPTDNVSLGTLAPDVHVASVRVLRHRDADQQVVVRTQLTGVPRGTRTIRFRVSGSSVGTGPDEVHLTDGAAGADGEGDVNCFTSDADGTATRDDVYASCTGMGNDDAGSFYVDMRLTHPHGTPRTVTVTALPVGVDEAGATDDDAGTLTFD